MKFTTMRIGRFGLAAFLAVQSLCALAAAPKESESYLWTNPETGSFDDASNWRLDGKEVPAKPGAADTVMIKDFVDTTMTLSQNEKIDTLYFLLSSKLPGMPRRVLVDLNGHDLEVSNVFREDLYNDNLDVDVVFSGGRLINSSTTQKKFNFASDNTANCGGVLTLSNNTECVVSNGVTLYSKNYPSTLRVIDGSKLRFASTFQDQRPGPTTKDGRNKIVVSGAGSAIGATSYFEIYFNTDVYLLDGAELSAKNFCLANAGTGGNLCLVSNATIRTTALSTLVNGAPCSNLVVMTGGSLFANTGDGDKVGLTLAGASKGNASCGNVLDVSGDSSIDFTGSGTHILTVADYVHHSNEVWLGDGTISMSALNVAGNNAATAGTSSNNCFRIYGRRSLLLLTRNSGKACNFRYGSRLVYDIPADGFADAEGVPRAPIQVPNGGLAVGGENPLDASQKDRLMINADDFTRKHPNVTITLMTVGVDSGANFGKFADNFIYTGKPALKGTVTYDERNLYYTSGSVRGMVVIIR